MDLDYDSVKALASPTRLKMLNTVLDEEATTTKLSNELDKSKSTVSSHLKVLVDAGLLEKDEEEGRRRVIYRPTSKAEAVVNGREKKVKFSVVSSALTAVGGLFFLSRGIQSTLGYKGDEVGAEALESGPAGTTGTMDAEAGAANQTAQNASEVFQILQKVQEIQLETFLGAGLLIIAVLALLYAYFQWRLPEK